MGRPRAAAAGQNPKRRIGFDQTSRDLQVLRRYIMMNILLESEYQRAMLETELEWSVRYSTSRARSTHMERGVAP